MIDVDQVHEKKPPPPKKNLLVIGQEILETPEIIQPKRGPYGLPAFGKQYQTHPINTDIINPNKKKRKT